MYYMDDEDREEQEPREIETFVVKPGQCVVCGRPGQDHGCFRCGKPVCYNKKEYFGSSPCGGWILDSWHPAHPDENEFYCNVCLAANLVPSTGVEAAGMTFKLTDQKTLTIKIDGQARELNAEDTSTLVAYLWSERGEMFGKPYDPDTDEPSDTEPQLAAAGDDLGELPDHPF